MTAEAIAEMLGGHCIRFQWENLVKMELSWKNAWKSVPICSRWNALVLLDEADVFLEKRTSEGSITRNAMVSVMLRLVEYFQGYSS